MDICYSIYNIAAVLATACEVATFAYVIYSQISFTGKQKGRKEALRNILLVGKATIEDLEIAVLEQNADLPEEELDIIREDLARLKSFFYNTSSS